MFGCGQATDSARSAPAVSAESLSGAGVILSGQNAEHSEDFDSPLLTYGFVSVQGGNRSIKTENDMLICEYELDSDYMEGLKISGFEMGDNNVLGVSITFALETDYADNYFLILNGVGPQFILEQNFNSATKLYTFTYEFHDVPKDADNWLGLINNDKESAGKSFSFRITAINLRADKLETVEGQTVKFKEGGERFFDDFSTGKKGMRYSTEYGQSFVGYTDALDGRALKYSYPSSLAGKRPVLVLEGMTFAPGLKYVISCDLKITSTYQPKDYFFCLQGSPDIPGGESIAATKKVGDVYKVRVFIKNDTSDSRRMIFYFPYAGENDAIECYIDNLEIIAIEQVYVG